MADPADGPARLLPDEQRFLDAAPQRCPECGHLRVLHGSPCVENLQILQHCGVCQRLCRERL